MFTCLWIWWLCFFVFVVVYVCKMSPQPSILFLVIHIYVHSLLNTPSFSISPMPPALTMATIGFPNLPPPLLLSSHPVFLLSCHTILPDNRARQVYQKIQTGSPKLCTLQLVQKMESKRRYTSSLQGSTSSSNTSYTSIQAIVLVKLTGQHFDT